MRNIYAMFLLAMILASCERPEYHNIPEEDKFLFKANEILVFKSASGAKDSLAIEIFSYYKDHDKRYHYENLDVRYFVLKNRIKNVVDIMFFHQGSGSGFGDARNTSLSLIKKDDTYILNTGIEIQRVDVFKGDSKKVQHSDIVEIFYHRNYGIVKYKYFDGEYFELQVN